MDTQTVIAGKEPRHTDDPRRAARARLAKRTVFSAAVILALVIARVVIPIGETARALLALLAGLAMVNYAFLLEMGARLTSGRLAGPGELGRHLLCAAALVYAYFCFRPSVLPALGGLQWIYPIPFAALTGLVLVGLLTVTVREARRLVRAIRTRPPREQPTGEKEIGKRMCSECGRWLPEGAKFCRWCGGAVEVLGEEEPKPKTQCPACAKPVKPEHRFCHSCGSKLEAE